MTMKSSLLLLLLACSTPNLGNALAQYSGFNLTNATLSSTLSSTNLVTNYTCTLYNLWTQSRQPASYPPNPSFFSPLLVAHSNAYTLWASGSTATQGLNSMVLTGATDQVINEINNAGDAVLDFQQGTEQNVLLLLEQSLFAIQVDKDHPYLTSVTPFSPSPDWFNGFYEFSTIDSETNFFYQSLSIDVFAWDLGTVTGDTYTAAGSPINPFDPISEFTLATIPSSDIFLDSTRTQVLPVASWTCTLSLGGVEVIAPGAPGSKTSDATSTTSWSRMAHVVAFFAGLLSFAF